VNYEWLVTEDLEVTVLPDPDGATRLLVTDSGKRWAAVVKDDVETGEGCSIVTVNGEWYDFGDDLPVVLGLLDEAAGRKPGDEFYSAAAEA